VFARAVKLSEQRLFHVEKLAGALADDLKAADKHGELDGGSHYRANRSRNRRASQASAACCGFIFSR